MQPSVGHTYSTQARMQGTARSRVLLSISCLRQQLLRYRAAYGSGSYYTSALQQESSQSETQFTPTSTVPPTQQKQPSPQHSPAQQQQHLQTVQKQQLEWQELHRAAQIAAWSGLCYHLPEDLQERINQQHSQLTLVAHGRNEYTSWYIADGVVPHKHFCTTVRQRTTAAAAGTIGTNSTSSQGSNSNSPANSTDGTCQADGGSEYVDVCEVPHGTRERFVFMRGVQWSAHDMDSRKLSQALMRLWPTPFPRTPPKAPNRASSAAPAAAKRSNGSGTAAATVSAVGSSTAAAAAAGSSLVAHEGVAEIAEALFAQLRPYLDQADDVGMPICFAGHSLGGSLGMLNMVLYQLHSRRRHSNHPTCYTFGSPPVLAHEQGGGGHRALAAVGLPDSCVKNFVLENDPVPRALLSVDPTFEMLKGWGAVKGLLQLRELVAGAGSPLSPSRFLFESVGQVHLIKWTQEGGSEVVPLDAHEIETELSFLSPKPASQKAAGSSTSSTASSSSSSVRSSSDASEAEGHTSQAASVTDGLSGIAAAAASVLSQVPVRYAQAWLDHHHGSYAQELEAAALRGVKQQVAQRQQQQQQKV